MTSGTNILLFGQKIKLLPIYSYCKENNYNIRVLDIANPHAHDSFDISQEQKFNDDFIPDLIINFKEQEKYLIKEKQLSEKYGLDTFLTEDNIKFFSDKSEQDRIFKSLNIPTVPNDSDTLIQKTNLSGGTNFKIVNRSDSKGFCQNLLDIHYIVSCHFYADDRYWYWLNNHIMYYENNCPRSSYAPYMFNTNSIEYYIKKLSKQIPIRNKLFGWQFLFDKFGNMYSIDFNLRPFGGFDKGSYDTEVSNESWTSYLFGKTPPSTIDYYKSVRCVYKEKLQFGYSNIDRIVTKLKDPISHEVKKYDTL